MRQGGFSLIELVMVIAVGGILMALGLPAFKTVLDSAKSKAAAESVLSGLRFARGEAIKRNVPMRFQLVSTLDNTCALSATSVLWVVNQDDNAAATRSPVAACGAETFTPADDPDPCNAAKVTHPAGNPACNDDPFIAFKSDSRSFSGVTITVVPAAATTITFGPLGQVLTNFPPTTASLAQITVTPNNPDAKTWRVRVTGANGGIKFCDPALAAGQPLAC
jgi:type IV fimbrial biogenesis protein FimT